jgi:hypothetical protein
VGKLVASGAITCGVLVLALPITIIVDNFMKVAGDDDEPGGSGVDGHASPAPSGLNRLKH